MGEVIRRVKWLVWELYDNLELKNLHVYGDLLTFYNLPVSDASLAEIGRLYIKFRVFEARLLTLYASYILSRAGYHIADIASDDFAEIEGKKIYTTQFNDEDWIEWFENLPPGELDEIEFTPWDMDYENREGKKLKVFFIKLLVCTSNYDEVQTLIRHFRKGISNIVVAHPLLLRKEKDAFMKAKVKMREYLGRDALLSTGEFVIRFLPDKVKRVIVEENWKTLREKFLKKEKKRKNGKKN